jgi:hypothetical protein
MNLVRWHLFLLPHTQNSCALITADNNRDKGEVPAETFRVSGIGILVALKAIGTVPVATEIDVEGIFAVILRSSSSSHRASSITAGFLATADRATVHPVC